MKVTAVWWKYDKRKNGTAAVKIRISHETKSWYYPINVYLNKNEWDPKKMRAQSVVNAQDINFKIIAALSAGEKAIINSLPFPEVERAVLEAIDPDSFSGKKTDHDPMSYFKWYLDECIAGRIIHQKTKQPLAKGYTVSINSTYVRLIEFLAEKRKKGFEFSDINEQFYVDLVNFLRNEYRPKLGKSKKIAKTKGVKENTIGTTIKRMVTVFKRAKKDGYSIPGDLSGFHVITQEVDTIALSEAEIEKIRTADLTGKPRLEKERNRFFISYNFLLRFNDSIRVDAKHIHKEGQRRFLRMTTGKTKEPVFIPIMPIVYDILEKNNFKVSQISNQKSNEYIKELGEACGLTDDYTITEYIKGKRVETTYKRYELITTHTTRRSAATNLYLSGMDLNSIRMFGGWKSIKQLMDYIKVDKLENAKLNADHPFFKMGQ
jgi:site-specific recombinase XerD